MKNYDFSVHFKIIIFFKRVHLQILDFVIYVKYKKKII